MFVHNACACQNQQFTPSSHLGRFGRGGGVLRCFELAFRQFFARWRFCFWSAPRTPVTIFPTIPCDRRSNTPTKWLRPAWSSPSNRWKTQNSRRHISIFASAPKGYFRSSSSSRIPPQRTHICSTGQPSDWEMQKGLLEKAGITAGLPSPAACMA